jgi:hypothetical protein
MAAVLHRPVCLSARWGAGSSSLANVIQTATETWAIGLPGQRPHVASRSVASSALRTQWPGTDILATPLLAREEKMQCNKP